MGVLKVWDAATWRKGGCGGTAATTPDSFSIQSNHLAGSSSATPQFAYANVGSANVTLDVDWSASLVGSTAGVLLHYVDTSNFFVAARDGVYRMNGGAWSLVASYSGGATFGAGDHMQVAITTGGGFHPIVKKNGTQVAVLTVGGGGAIQTSSLNGFYCASDSTSRWDNWAASGCTTPSTDAFTGTDGDPLNPALWTVIPALTVATVGRLRLWTGTEWVREACDDDSFTDDFNRANGALGSPWSAPHGGTWTVTSNQALMTAAPGGGMEPIAVVPGTTLDATVQADLTVAVHPGASIIFNYLSPGNFCMWNIAPGTSALYKFTAHNPTGLASPAAAGSGTYKVVIDPGGSVDLYKNGTLVQSVAVALHSGGFGAGVQSAVTSSNPADNFSLTPTAHPLKVKVASGGDVLASDNFNRANGTIGNGWIEARRELGMSTMTWAISSNKATCTVNNSYASTAYDALLLRDCGTADFEMSFAVSNLPTSPAFGHGELAAWRVADVNASGAAMSYFLLFYRPSVGLTVFELAPGSGGGFSTGSTITLTAGDIITIRCSGSLHEISVNGTLSFSFTRTMNQTTGLHHGIASLGTTWGDSTTFDDFTISTLVDLWTTVACMVPV